MLLCSIVSAVEFDVSLFPAEQTLKLNETADFELEVRHTSPVEEFFEVFSSDVTWDVIPERPIRVGPSETFRSKLSVRPLNLNPGAYNVPLTFKRSGSVDATKKVVYLELRSPVPEEGSFLPAVRGVAKISSPVDPREKITLKLSLENQNRRTLDKVDVKVRSAILNKDYTTTLGPLEKKTLTFEAELDEYTPAGEAPVQISIIVPENERAYQFDLFPVVVEVLPFGTVVPSKETTGSFLKYTQVVTLENKANREVTHLYRIPAWNRLFVTSAGHRIEGGNFVWEVRLKPGERAQITIVYNYRPLLWVLLLGGALWAAYFVFRSPIVVRKRVDVIGSSDDATELKVLIELRNRGKVLQHVHVLDLVPRLVDVVKDAKMVPTPSKVVTNAERGTLLRWDLGVVDPKEQRVLMYRIKTKLGVLGGLSLPVAAVKFTVQGVERETVSNKPETKF